MPTALPATIRYTAPGIVKRYWIPGLTGIANIASPLRAEMEAGLDLSKQVREASGWDVTTNKVAAPDEGSKFTSQVNGRITPGDAMIVFYASRDTADIRTVLSRDDEGFIIILDGGDVPGQLMRVFAVQVSAVTPVHSSPGTDPSFINVPFSITDFAEKVVIPALS